jgi:hypothetical protein
LFNVVRKSSSQRKRRKTHLARQVFNGNSDGVGLLAAVLDGEVADAVFDDVAEQEGEDLVVVGRDAEVFAVQRDMRQSATGERTRKKRRRRTGSPSEAAF